MNFVFEQKFYNLITCPDRNPSGVGRVTESPMIQALMRFAENKFQFSNINLDDIKWSNDPDKFDRYIIPLGVAHSPRDWAGVDQKNTGHLDQAFPDRQSLFYFIKPTYLQHMVQGRAFLLLDQCHEGYHAPWLYDWFHTGAQELGFSPRQIIYVTGDLDVTKKYDQWCLERNITEKMCTVGHPHFELNVHTHAVNSVKIYNNLPMPTVDEQIAYKKSNLEKIKLYNALQKRPRAHRVWLFLKLVQNNLLEDGINSMNLLSQRNCYYHNKFMSDQDYALIEPLLPMLPPHTEVSDVELQDFANMDSGKYQMRMNDDISMDSWFSIISEASFAENQCFLSEKTFKPLMVGHPFIVYGNRGSLSYLRDFGYKTFHPWIDESYDDLDCWERLDAIVHAINKVKVLTDRKRLKWFMEMRDILIHNQEVIKKNSTECLPGSYIKIKNHFEQNVLRTS